MEVHDIMDTKIDSRPTLLAIFSSADAGVPLGQPAPELISVRLEEIVPCRWQPRQQFDPAALLDLANDIANHGVLTPPLVWRNEDEEAMNELLNQLQATLAEAEANNADAQKWRELVAALARLGFNSRIGPQDVIKLIEMVRQMGIALQEALGGSEGVPPQAPPKRMPRRKLTEEDESQIRSSRRQGFTAAQIAEDLGVAKSSVEKFWLADD